MATITYKYNTATSSGTDWSNPSNCVDNTNGTYATRSVAKNTTETSNYILASENDASSLVGGITKVEIGVEAKQSGSTCAIVVEPIFNGSTTGSKITTSNLSTSDTTPYVDITSDSKAPSSWTLTDIQNLDVKLYGKNTSYSNARTISIDQIYIRVTYIVYIGPEPPVSTKLHVYKYSTITNTDFTPDNFSSSSTSATLWDFSECDYNNTAVVTGGQLVLTNPSDIYSGQSVATSKKSSLNLGEYVIKLVSYMDNGPSFGLYNIAGFLLIVDLSSSNNIKSQIGSNEKITTFDATINFPLWFKFKYSSITYAEIYYSLNKTSWTLLDSGNPGSLGTYNYYVAIECHPNAASTVSKYSTFDTVVDMANNTATAWVDPSNALSDSATAAVGTMDFYSSLSYYSSTLKFSNNNNVYSDTETITKVEVIVRCNTNATFPGSIYVTPIFNGSRGSTLSTTLSSGISGASDSSFNITSITNSPSTWSWSDIENIELEIFGYMSSSSGYKIYIYEVEIKTTTTGNTPLNNAIFDDFEINEIGIGEKTDINLYNNTTDMTNTLQLYAGGERVYAHLRPTTYTGYKSPLRIRKDGITYMVATQYDVE